VTGTLEPEFSGSVAGVHNATKMNTSQVERGDLLEYGIVRIKRIHEVGWYIRRPRQTGDHVLVIGTSGDGVRKIEEFRIFRRRIEITF